MNENGDSLHPSDDLAAFALDALGPEEEARVREHLAGCERCRSELEWLQPAVDVLPATVPQVEPPRGLKRDLMKTVRSEARAERGGWWARQADWISLRARPALAIVGVALLGGGIAGYAINEANQSTEPTLTQVEADPSAAAAGASGTLEHSTDDASLAVSGMDQLEGGDVYQVWYGEGEGVEPAKSFTVDAEGDAEADLGEIPEGTEQVMVTAESEPGLPSPEGEILLSASLT
jgi:hypothetical protein